MRKCSKGTLCLRLSAIARIGIEYQSALKSILSAYMTAFPCSAFRRIQAFSGQRTAYLASEFNISLVQATSKRISLNSLRNEGYGMLLMDTCDLVGVWRQVTVYEPVNLAHTSLFCRNTIMMQAWETKMWVLR